MLGVKYRDAMCQKTTTSIVYSTHPFSCASDMNSMMNCFSGAPVREALGFLGCHALA